MTNFLIVFRRAPFGWVSAVEAIRLSAAAASEHPLEVIFIDDGVYCLMKGQMPKAIGHPPIDRSFKMLQDLKVKYHVVQESLQERGVKTSDIDPDYSIEVTPLEKVAQIIQRNQVIISF
nr:DsrE family protein [Candidatus Njordarchaeum guaymaensis]